MKEPETELQVPGIESEYYHRGQGSQGVTCDRIPKDEAFDESCISRPKGSESLEK